MVGFLRDHDAPAGPDARGTATTTSAPVCWCPRVRRGARRRVRLHELGEWEPTLRSAVVPRLALHDEVSPARSPPAPGTARPVAKGRGPRTLAGKARRLSGWRPRQRGWMGPADPPRTQAGLPLDVARRRSTSCSRTTCRPVPCCATADGLRSPSGPRAVLLACCRFRATTGNAARGRQSTRQHRRTCHPWFQTGDGILGRCRAGRWLALAVLMYEHLELEPAPPPHGIREMPCFEVDAAAIMVDSSGRGSSNESFEYILFVGHLRRHPQPFPQLPTGSSSQASIAQLRPSF